MDEKQKKIDTLFDKGILVNKEVLEKEVDPTIYDKIETEADLIVLNSDYLDVI